MKPTIAPWLFELTYMLKELGSLSKIAALAESAPEDPPAAATALRAILIALGVGTEVADPAHAVRRALEARMRQAILPAGDVGETLVARLVECANRRPAPAAHAD
jgi:hypothetical protein